MSGLAAQLRRGEMGTSTAAAGIDRLDEVATRAAGATKIVETRLEHGD